MIVRVERELIIVIEARRVAQEEPQLRIVWRRLRSSLRILHGERMIAFPERFQCRVRQAGILNVRPPTQRLRWSLRLDALLLRGFFLRLGRSARTYCVGLRIAGADKRDSEHRHIGNFQEARWNNQWVTELSSN